MKKYPVANEDGIFFTLKMGIENSGVSENVGNSKGLSSLRLASAVSDSVEGITYGNAIPCECRMETCMRLQTELIARYADSVGRSFDDAAFEWINACSESFRKLFDSGKTYSLDEYGRLLESKLREVTIH